MKKYIQKLEKVLDGLFGLRHAIEDNNAALTAGMSGLIKEAGKSNDLIIDRLSKSTSEQVTKLADTVSELRRSNEMIIDKINMFVSKQRNDLDGIVSEISIIVNEQMKINETFAKSLAAVVENLKNIKVSVGAVSVASPAPLYEYTIWYNMEHIHIKTPRQIQAGDEIVFYADEMQRDMKIMTVKHVQVMCDGGMRVCGNCHGIFKPH